MHDVCVAVVASVLMGVNLHMSQCIILTLFKSEKLLQLEEVLLAEDGWTSMYNFFVGRLELYKCIYINSNTQVICTYMNAKNLDCT
jgi:hypothetical protein